MVASARRPFTRSLAEAEDATNDMLSAPLGGCCRGPTGGSRGGSGGGGASRGLGGGGGGGGGSPCSPIPPSPPDYVVLIHDYQLGRTLWRGTNSHVLEAVRRADGAAVAVKAVSKACLSGRGRAALTREVLTLKRLTQIGGGVAVCLLDVVEDTERVYLVTELLQGGTLLQWVLGGGERGVPLVLEVARQLLGALAECHSMGVCHNDVKLENVMLAAPLGGEREAAAVGSGGSRSRPSPTDSRAWPDPPPSAGTAVDGAMPPGDAPTAEASPCREAAGVADVTTAASDAASPYRDIVDVRLIDFGLCFWRRRPRTAAQTPDAAGQRDDSSTNGGGALPGEANPSGLQTPPTRSHPAPSPVQSATRGCGDGGAKPPAGERGVCATPVDVVVEYRHTPGVGESSPALSVPSTPVPSVPRSSRTSGVRLNNPVGTAAYAAPELVMRLPYDPRAADVWASGVVVYALVAHRLPFGSPATPGGMAALGRRITTEEPTFTGRDWAAVPPGLVDLLRRMLCKDPDRRLSMRAALDTLDSVVRAMPPSAHASADTSGSEGEDGNGLTRALAAAEELARSVGAGTAALVAAFMAATCRLGPLYTAPTTPGRPCPPRRCLSRSASLRSLSPAGSTGSTPGAARGVRRKREEGDGRPVPVADGNSAGQRAPSRRRADLRGETDSADGSTDDVA
ncbi:hypothetical protein MMPV_003454 [Pyropia vietnamensis]